MNRYISLTTAGIHQFVFHNFQLGVQPVIYKTIRAHSLRQSRCEQEQHVLRDFRFTLDWIYPPYANFRSFEHRIGLADSNREIVGLLRLLLLLLLLLCVA